MKIFLGITLVLFLASSGFAYQLLERIQLKEQQVTDSREQLSGLLAELESNSRERLQYEKQIDSLQNELGIMGSQLNSVSRQLQASQSDSDDIQAIESEIRQHLLEEFRQAERDTGGSRSSLVKQLAMMDAMDRAEFMSMQNRYGNFLAELDVSDERMEVIINALNNVVATENQARLEVLQQLQSGEVGVDELRQRMQGVHDPQSQLNQLSYVLTEEELAAFSAYQDTQSGPIIAGFGQPADGSLQNQTFYLGTAADGLPVNGEIRVLSVAPD